MTATTVLPMIKYEKIVYSLIMAAVCPHSMPVPRVKKPHVAF